MSHLIFCSLALSHPGIWEVYPPSVGGAPEAQAARAVIQEAVTGLVLRTHGGYAQEVLTSPGPGEHGESRVSVGTAESAVKHTNALPRTLYRKTLVHRT